MVMNIINSKNLKRVIRYISLFILKIILFVIIYIFVFSLLYSVKTLAGINFFDNWSLGDFF